MVQRVWTLGAAALLIAGAAACAPDRAGSQADEVAPDVRFEALTFEVYREAKLEAAGSAARARMRRDSSAIVADQIAVRFPPAPGREVPALLTAAQGSGNASERWFTVNGGVVAEQGADTVETEQARYDPATRLVRGDSPVVVHGDRYVLRGPGFTLDPDARTVRVDGGATLRSGGDAR